MTGLFIPSIPPIAKDAAAAASARMDNLTKPRASLGRLEELAIRVAGIQARPLPAVDRTLCVVAAGDHGVTARGVSAYPAEVTGQMVRNFLAGGAAVNVLARWAGSRLLIVDAGTTSAVPGPVDMRLGAGTADFSRGPAMAYETAVEAVRRGIELGCSTEADAIACGEMGIGNSTAASAIVAALLGLPAQTVTGPGAGLDGEGMRRKGAVIQRALEVNHPDAADPLDVLARVGGFEIGVLAGLMIGVASVRGVVMLDGFISSAAALIAARLAPAARHYMVASHLSPEPAHTLILEELALKPLLDLELRLGEGTGALLALPLLDAACRLLAQMATFAGAGVSDRDEEKAPFRGAGQPRVFE